MDLERIFHIVELLLPSGMSMVARIKGQDGQIMSERELVSQTDADFQNVIDRGDQ